jgi:D-alanyl-D-alanine carboxypeptidase (penicillin-binding protein 5/6)
MFWRRSCPVAIMVAIGVAAFSFMPLTASADNHTSVNLGLNVRSAVLIEAETGQVLYAMDENQPYQPASMTKMMTEYLVMEEIGSGRMSWDDMIVTSKAAAESIGSGQLMAEGISYPARKVFELLSIYSGNDAAVAFAEYIAGTEEQFAIRMNETAQQMGLSSNSIFINSTGLSRADMGSYAPPSIAGETLLTAMDAARLARRIVLDHPDVLEIAKIPQLKFQDADPKPMINWNWMLEGNKENVNLRQFAYEGLDGLKTGHTSDAGYCFTGTAARDGMRLISVVMGAESQASRFNETRKLLDYGFNSFEKKTIVTAKTELPDVKTVFIRNGVKQDIPVVIGGGVEMIVQRTKSVEPEVTVEVFTEDQLKAPLKAEDQVGVITVSVGGETQQVPLIVTEDVEKASWFRMVLRDIADFFTNLF